MHGVEQSLNDGSMISCLSLSIQIVRTSYEMRGPLPVSGSKKFVDHPAQLFMRRKVIIVALILKHDEL